MPCGLLFYVCWIIKMDTCGKKRYMILKRVKQMIIELTIYAQIISCECFIKSCFRSKILFLNTYVYLLLAIVHNIVIPGYKVITLHIFFLVLFGN